MRYRRPGSAVWTWSSPTIAFQDGAPGSTTFYVAADNVTGTDSGFAGSGTVTDDTDPNPTGYNGTATYTYLWQHIATLSGNTPSISATNIQNPTWSATVTDGTDSESVWRVVMKDSSSPQQAAAADIRVILTWVNLS